MVLPFTLHSRAESTATRSPFEGSAEGGILEIFDDFDGDAYRAVYTVRYAGRVYVLHVFQKKSKTGIKTPKAEINLILSRLKRAGEEHKECLERQKGTKRNG